MKDRKATKASDVAQSAVTEKVKSVSRVDIKATKEKREVGDAAKGTMEETVKIKEVSKKMSNIRRDTTADADTAQRDAAMHWASAETSDANIVTQSTIGKSSKKAADKIGAIVMEDLQSLEAQNFIAGQYPTAEEGVSSTVRLGMAFVSGALCRRTDDPKIFGASVKITECNVRIQTTKEKARMAVSAAPPNSIDSEAEAEGASDVQLSQSATDLCTQIELPEGDAEFGPREADGDKGINRTEEEVADISVAPGFVMASLLPHAGKKNIADDRHTIDVPKTSEKQGVVGKILTTPRSVILSDFNRLMGEIDVSTLFEKN